MASAAVRSKAVVQLLMNNRSVCWGFVFGAVFMFLSIFGCR